MVIIVPKELNLDSIPIEKLINKSIFVRRGKNRRQDHGSRGNCFKKRYDTIEWKIEARKRRDFRACGRS